MSGFKQSVFSHGSLELVGDISNRKALSQFIVLIIFFAIF
jgi:hypothetical protein